MKVLITDKINQKAVDIVSAVAEVDNLPTMSEDELVDVIGKYDALLVRSQTKVTEKIINAASNMKIIGRAGVGVDNIDVTAATEKGIWVVNSPNGNTEATAEHTIGMMLALSRKIPQACASVNDGKFERAKFLGCELLGKTLAIIGFGKIGSRVAEIAKVLGMNIIVYDPFATRENVEACGCKKVDTVEELLPICDYLTVHVPKNKDTIDLINAENIYKMKKGAMIVNCARGGIINECELANALSQGHISGAAIDVFVDEPNITACPLYKASENLIMVPHLGASTIEAQVKVAKDVAQQLTEVLKGGKPTTPVNKL